MGNRKTYTTMEALEMLQNMDSGDSDGGSEFADDLDSESEQESEAEEEPIRNPTPQKKRVRLTEESVEMARDNTAWTEQHLNSPNSEVPPAHTVFTDTAGPTPHARARVTSRLSSFLCLLDMSMLLRIRQCTVTHARCTNPTWDMSVDELMAFIALLYYRGLWVCSDMDENWSETYGPAFYRDTMSRNRYRDIMRYLRFDDKNTRQQRLCTDRFAAISDIWGSFVQNCRACYTAGEHITVDEQLFPTKCCCPFTQYISRKPDKFGIKFWIAADLETKYMLNAIPYLGKDPTRAKGERLADTVVMKLMEPFMGKGRTVTTDNFFTSLSLANRLVCAKTSLLGTMSKVRRELPPSAKDTEKREQYSTKVFRSGMTTLTVYVTKPKKSVCLLSTKHQTVTIQTDHKRKPNTVNDYNHTKCGVDTLDQMTRMYTTKSGTRRWPVAVFYNLLDLAAINAHVLYKACVDPKETRRRFLTALAEELREQYLQNRMAKKVSKAKVRRELRVAHLLPGKKTQCQVGRCNKNRTRETCVKCGLYICGTCTKKLDRVCINC